MTLLGCAFGSLSPLTPRPWHLYAVFAVLGVVGIGASALAYSRAVTSWFERRRGAALSVVVSGGAIVGMVHPSATQALIDIFDWRGACRVLGGAVLAIGVPMVAL